MRHPPSCSPAHEFVEKESKTLIQFISNNIQRFLKHKNYISRKDIEIFFQRTPTSSADALLRKIKT